MKSNRDNLRWLFLRHLQFIFAGSIKERKKKFSSTAAALIRDFCHTSSITHRTMHFLSATRLLLWPFSQQLQIQSYKGSHPRIACELCPITLCSVGGCQFANVGSYLQCSPQIDWPTLEFWQLFCIHVSWLGSRLMFGTLSLRATQKIQIYNLPFRSTRNCICLVNKFIDKTSKTQGLTHLYYSNKTEINEWMNV